MSFFACEKAILQEIDASKESKIPILLSFAGGRKIFRPPDHLYPKSFGANGLYFALLSGKMDKVVIWNALGVIKKIK
jgi:hypothetical protein